MLVEAMKFLYYTPIPWPSLDQPFASFPHDNRAFNAAECQAIYASSMRLFTEAEAAGFDWLGVGEEHMNAYGVVPNPCLIASALSMITRRARIAILGNPLPILNPLRVAEEYAMVDVLSNGRLVAGFPRGVPQNYAAYSMSLDDSREKFEEAVALVIKAWSCKGVFDWHGTHYKFANVSLWPQPQTMPELIFSAKSEQSINLAVKHRGMLAELYIKNEAVLVHFRSSVRAYQQLASGQGWVANKDRFLLNVPCVIARSDEIAKSRAARALSYLFGNLTGSYEAQKSALRDSYYSGTAHLLDSEKTIVENRINYGGLICGTPNSVVEQIQRLTDQVDVGVLGLQMHFGNLTETEVLESIRLFPAVIKTLPITFHESHVDP